MQLPWIYHGNPERCYLSGHRGPCNSRMKLFARQTDSVRGTCDCDDAGTYTTSEKYFNAKNKTFCNHEKRNLAYYIPKRQCYYLFERVSFAKILKSANSDLSSCAVTIWTFHQGPCYFGEWLIINQQGRVICEPRRCPKNLYDTTSYRTPYWYFDPYKNSCHQAYTRGYCPKHHLLIPTKSTWIPQCVNTKVSCNDLLPASVAIPTLRCSEGSYCSQVLDGRKSYYTRSRHGGRRRQRSWEGYHKALVFNRTFSCSSVFEQVGVSINLQLIKPGKGKSITHGACEYVFITCIYISK